MAGIELSDEQSTTFGFVSLAEPLGGIGQPDEAREESPVRRMNRAHVAAAPPTIGAERVETPVVTDTEVGVPLDRIGGDRTQFGPHVGGSWVDANGLGQYPSAIRLRARCRMTQRGLEGRRRRRKDGLGRSRGCQPDGVRVAHAPSLLAVARRCDIAPSRDRYASPVTQILALSADVLKNITTFGALLPILIGLLIVKLAVNAVVRTIVLVIALALGVLIFTQRSTIQTCVDDFKAQVGEVATTGSPTFSCSVFGRDFRLEL